MKPNKIDRYYNTLKHLKLRQFYYQAYYRIRKVFIRKPLAKTKPHLNAKGHTVHLLRFIPSAESYRDKTFRFLNREKLFNDGIDWDFMEYGKLWAYNLNYFEYLNQDSLDANTGISLITDFCKHLEEHQQASEPYTISLRGINWIKFFASHGICSPEFDYKLHAQFRWLASSLEYHLLGNHLLENGFSLLFAAYYFRDEQFYRKAEAVLESELKEQILGDGAHFELSPMYHQIILLRLLDAINLVQSNTWKNGALLSKLAAKAQAMLGWLKAITFKNGDIPMVNDSAPGIAPYASELFAYASRLNIVSRDILFSDSGYDMIRGKRFELFIDRGHIGPDYIPGHAHSDTFSFILHVNSRPIIVDTGTSTYESNSRRHLERSTSSHNTVVINNLDQSEVWASFRVGRRAKIIDCSRQDRQISASHDGYRTIGQTHTRTWNWTDHEIRITDLIEGERIALDAVALLHFHPGIQLNVRDNFVETDFVRISFDGHVSLQEDEYDMATGFNKTTKGRVLKIAFHRHLETVFHPIDKADG